jgi:iron(III) transport system substrate-binding protein
MKAKKMKKFFAIAVLVLSGIAVSCKEDPNTVYIYTASYDFEIELFQKRLAEEFPQYNVVITYMPTGNLAAKLKAEGTATDMDIVGAMMTLELDALADNLADLSEFDTSEFLDELVPANHKYLPFAVTSGCVIINNAFLAARNIPVPTSYKDLTKPEYKGVLSMPNPRSSSTGWCFLVKLVNEWGEDAAFDYFDMFAQNTLQFTTSGSGPLNALIQNEAGIGFVLTLDAVRAVNMSIPMTVTFFDEGSPYVLEGNAMVKGKETKQAVKDVFEFFSYTVSREHKELFAPDPIFKDQKTTIANYPQNVIFADMTGVDDFNLRERLLVRWKF